MKVLPNCPPSKFMWRFFTPHFFSSPLEHPPPWHSLRLHPPAAADSDDSASRVPIFAPMAQCAAPTAGLSAPASPAGAHCRAAGRATPSLPQQVARADPSLGVEDGLTCRGKQVHPDLPGFSACRACRRVTAVARLPPGSLHLTFSSSPPAATLEGAASPRAAATTGRSCCRLPSSSSLSTTLRLRSGRVTRPLRGPRPVPYQPTLPADGPLSDPGPAAAGSCEAAVLPALLMGRVACEVLAPLPGQRDRR